jgi:hypothetical protein
MWLTPPLPWRLTVFTLALPVARASEGIGCTCLDMLPGLVGNVTVLGIDYGADYGLRECAAHDAGKQPFCSGFTPQGAVNDDVPSWCNDAWCYVDGSTCASAVESSYAPGLHYSSLACGTAADEFASFFSSMGGTVQLCSVFSAKDAALLEGVAGADSLSSEPQPCENTQTHVQVEAMVLTINALNGGRGFALEMGRPTAPTYFRFNYTWHTYPYGAWEAEGRALSEAVFSGGACDLVVGMAHGCPDEEIMQQALVANATRRIYVTARGPRQVLTQMGAVQPYFFSSHLRSDRYAYLGLQQVSLQPEGPFSLAIVGEDYGNFFFNGLFNETVTVGRSLGLHLAYAGTVCRPDAACGAPGTQIDEAGLRAHLDAVVAARADVLVLALRGAEFQLALEHLKTFRPRASGAESYLAAEGAHVFKAIWWQGIQNLGPLGGECLDLAEQCAYMMGGGQMGAQEGATYVDALVGETYTELQRSSAWTAAGGAGGSLLSGYADGAMIPSLFAQSMQSVFRFRELEDVSSPLGSATEYELLRMFMKSGEEVARTMYGPVRFDSIGANAGREPTTFQFVSQGGAHMARVIFPLLIAETNFEFPSPGSSECVGQVWTVADGNETCLLCEPDVCIDAAPPPPAPTDQTVAIYSSLGAVGALLGLVLLWLAVRFAREMRKRLERRRRAEAEFMLASIERLRLCATEIATLQFSLCFVRLVDFEQHGSLLPHEQVRERGELTVLDTFEEVQAFVQLRDVIFISQCARQSSALARCAACSAWCMRPRHARRLQCLLSAACPPQRSSWQSVARMEVTRS